MFFFYFFSSLFQRSFSISQWVGSSTIQEAECALCCSVYGLTINMADYDHFLKSDWYPILTETFYCNVFGKLECFNKCLEQHNNENWFRNYTIDCSIYECFINVFPEHMCAEIKKNLLFCDTYLTAFIYLFTI